MSQIDHQFFAIFGHDINKKSKENFLGLLKREESTSRSVAYAKQIWQQAAKNLIDQRANNSRIVVPLSGGLDSRLILASLLEFYDAKEIYTFTFGKEGSFDFEIGNMIAEKAGTNHFAAPCTVSDYSIESEKEWALHINAPTTLFYHPPMNIVREFKDDELWVGYMGDPLAGSHLIQSCNTPESASKKYLNKYTSIPLEIAREYGIDLKYVEAKVKNGVNWGININAFENVDFSLRQEQYIKPHVVFSENHQLPFLHKKWLNFMMNLPDEQRQGEAFYRSFVLEAYPDLFKLPCKNNYGYRIGNKASKVYKLKAKLFPSYRKKMVNYIDFDLNLRNDNSLSKLVKGVLLDHQEDRFFSQIERDKIWQDFISRKINFGFVFNLVSLYILDSK